MDDPALFAEATVGVAVVDSISGKILTANDAYCSLLGRARESVIGKTWMHFTYPEDVGRIVYVIHKMHETHSAQAFAGRRYIDGNGEIVQADLTVRPFFHGETEKTHLAIVRAASPDGPVPWKVSDR